MTDSFNLGVNTLIKWAAIAAVILWTFAFAGTFIFDGGFGFFCVLITVCGFFGMIVAVVGSCISVSEAIEYIRLKKSDPSSYKVRGVSASTLEWVARLEAFGRWVEGRQKK